MAEVKWIKITTDIFDDEKIRLIESMPDGDSLIVIWFKLLCMAGKMNNCGVFMMNNRIAYTEDMLAILFNRPLNTVRLAITTFEQFGMIEIVNNIITIPNWEKHQNIDGMEKIREQTRARVQKHREKMKLECNVTSNATVTDGNALEEDKDKEEEKDNIPYKDIINHLNSSLGSSYKHTTKKTKELIKARFNEGFTYEDFSKVIDKKVAEWKGTEMARYLRPETLFGNKFEGYLNQEITANKKANFPQRNNNYDALTAMLVNS